MQATGRVARLLLAAVAFSTSVSTLGQPASATDTSTSALVTSAAAPVSTTATTGTSAPAATTTSTVTDAARTTTSGTTSRTSSAAGNTTPAAGNTTPAARDSCDSGWIPGLGGDWTDTPCAGLWERTDLPVPPCLRAEIRPYPALLRWVEAGKCPFGTLLPGQITYPKAPDASLEDIVGTLDTLRLIAVFYSYMPYVVAAFVIVSFLAQRGTRQLWVLMYLLLLLSVNEAIFKPLCKQPRPGKMLQLRDYSGRFVGSCVHACGMPSSHSSLAMGWFTLLFLDAVFRVHPFQINQSRSQACHTYSQAAIPAQSLCHRECTHVRTFLGMFMLVPWVPSRTLTHLQFLAHVLFWFLIMVPVPFMRVILYDHSMEQVTVGSLVGPITAVVWWRVVRCAQFKYRAFEGQRFFFGCLVHDYELPRFYLTRSWRIAAEGEGPLRDEGEEESQFGPAPGVGVSHPREAELPRRSGELPRRSAEPDGVELQGSAIAERADRAPRGPARSVTWRTAGAPAAEAARAAGAPLTASTLAVPGGSEPSPGAGAQV